MIDCRVIIGVTSPNGVYKLFEREQELAAVPQIGQQVVIAGKTVFRVRDVYVDEDEAVVICEDEDRTAPDPESRDMRTKEMLKVFEDWTECDDTHDYYSLLMRERFPADFEDKETEDSLFPTKESR